MRKLSKQIKRCMAMILTVAMLASLVTVTAGAAETVPDLYSVVAENLSAAEGAILTSDALKGNTELDTVSMPTDADELVDVDGEMKLTADSFASGLDKDWEPVAYATTNVNGGPGPEGDYDDGVKLPANTREVRVDYELDLTEEFGENNVLAAMNLPYQLVTMENTMKKLYGKKDELAELNWSVVTTLMSLCCTTWVPGEGLVPGEEYEELHTRLEKLLVEEIDQNTQKLKLHGTLAAYAGNIEYYWANAQEIYNQIESLYGVMTYLLELDDPTVADMGLQDMLTVRKDDIIDTLGQAVYDKAAGNIGKINDLVGSIEGVLNALDFENTKKYIDMIDQTADMTALIAAVESESANNAKKYEDPMAVMKATVKKEVIPSFELKVNLKIGSLYDDIFVNESFTYGEGPDVAALQTDIEAMVSEYVGSNVKHYDDNYDPAALDVLSGGMTADAEFSFVWEPKEYDVTLDGSDFTTVTVENATVILPKPDDEDTEFIYTLNGAPLVTVGYMSDGKYTFSPEQLSANMNIECTDRTVCSVTVNLVINGAAPVSVYVSCDEGTVPDIEDLKAQIDAKLGNELGYKKAYYTTTYNPEELDALAGVPLTKSENFTYTWDPTVYQVKLNEDDFTEVTIENLTVTLPEATEPGKRYEYSFDGVDIGTGGDYTFTPEDLSGNMVIEFEVKDAYVENLKDYVDAVNEKAGYEAFKLEPGIGGAYTGITANVSSVNDLMGIVQGMASNNPYPYVGLNLKPLFFGKVTIQTLIDAMLADASFNRDAVIELGKGSGCILNAKLQLGRTAEEKTWEYKDLDFKVNLTGVPSQITAISNMLNREVVKSHLDFKGDEGKLAIELTLPGKVYEVYLAALTMTGNVDLKDVDAVKKAVAYQFIADYVDILLGANVRYSTYANTAEKLGYDLDAYLGAYSEYIDLLLEMGFLLDDEGHVLVYEEGTGYSFGLKVTTDELNDLIYNKSGLDQTTSIMAMGLITECDYQNGKGLSIPMTMSVNIFDDQPTYEAIVISSQPLNGGMKEKLDTVKCSDQLAADLAAIRGGYTVVILQDDVSGDLVFNGTAVLDLNGYNVADDITANGSLFIIDRTMATATTGTVSGTVSGNVHILAGNYAQDVSKYLKAGYYQDGTAVRNYAYSIEEAPATFARSAAGGLNFVIDTDKLSAAAKDYNYKALAVDLVSDLILNYYYSAAMSFGYGNKNYSVYSVTALDDLIGLYADFTNGNLGEANIQELVASLKLAGDDNVQGFVNALLAGLLDLDAVYAAMEAGAPVASFTVNCRPWKLNLQHDQANDVFVAGIIPDPKKVTSTNIGVKITGSDAEALIYELKEINDGTTAKVTLSNLEYGAKKLSANAAATVKVSLDMTDNTNYAIVIAGILANGNVDNKDDFVAALKNFNGRDTTAIRTAFDEVTVEDLVTSMKALNSTTSFADICDDLDVPQNTNAADLESVYHAVLCVIGKLAEVYDITGPATKMGDLCTFEDGIYTYTADKSNFKYSGSQAIRQFNVDYSVTLNEISLTVDLFKTSTPSGSSALDTKNHFSYMVGYADGTLNPYGKMTRGQAATIFFRLLTDEAREQYWSQTNSYSDCDSALWCNNAISTLSKMGIINGYADGTFRPNEYVTRAQFAKMAVGFFNTTTKGYQGYFKDVEEAFGLSSYVEAAADAGLVQGYTDGTFRPNDYITRAQACVIINRALGRLPNKDYLLDEGKMLTWSDCSTNDWFYADVMEATNSHDFVLKNIKGEKTEVWTKKLEQRDWTALERSWSTAHSAPGGEV